MKITHLALWTNDLERLCRFYERYFGGVTGTKYSNEKKGFASYFVRFEGDTTLEIMQRTDISHCDQTPRIGLAHLAFDAGSREAVHKHTETLRANGYTIQSEPRTTGDGFYESAVLDPDGNTIEIIA